MQANLRGKVTREFEVRSPRDQFHQLIACKPYQFSKICPSIVKSCTAQEGEFGKKGTVIVWNFIQDGKACVIKEIIENLDMENKTITCRVIEGEVLNYYNTLLIHLDVPPKVGNISLAKWTFEYEKINEDVPDPTSLADVILTATKQGDDHLNA